MNIFEEMKNAVLEGESDDAVKYAEKAISDGLDIQRVMDDGFLAGISEAGDLFEEGEYYLPDLVCSADAMKSALEVLEPAMKAGAGVKTKGKVALVTVQGDVHDIGKTIVGAMLTASGYEVVDLGTDVPNEEVIQSVKEIRPQILGLSALLSTTMLEQERIIGLLGKEGLREQTKVIIGGAPVSQDWADKINADGYSDNAISAVRLVESLLG